MVCKPACLHVLGFQYSGPFAVLRQHVSSSKGLTGWFVLLKGSHHGQVNARLPPQVVVVLTDKVGWLVS